MKGLFLVVLFTIARNAYGTEFDVSSRQPKLFYVSSTTSTTTLSTNTVCYVPSSTDLMMLTCKKKKRSILSDSIGTTSEEISPAKSTQRFQEAVEKIKVDIEFNDKEDINELISGLDLTEREGRFLNYWLTTTTTTTFTSFTGTSTVASLLCTPPGYTNAGCPLPYGK